MSKLWLLLLFVAAFQFIQALPLGDEEFDEVIAQDVEYEDDEHVITDNEAQDFEDEERGGEKAKEMLEKIKKKMKKVAEKVKEAMKKGAKLLKEIGFKVNPLECEGKTCKSCILLDVAGSPHTFCMEMTLIRTNKATYLDVTLGTDTKKMFTQKIRLGEIPRCLKVGGFVGKICLKGLEGRAKSSKGDAKVNFCLGILAEKHGVGIKFCAKYIDKKFKVDFVPEIFVGGLDEETGEIVKKGEGGDNGVELDADEYEIDE